MNKNKTLTNQAVNDQTIAISDIQIEVVHLQKGMFVSKLDIPWDGSGYLLQGFHVDETNIDALKAQCKWVLVSKNLSHPGVVFLADKQENSTKTSNYAHVNHAAVIQTPVKQASEIAKSLVNVKSANTKSLMAELMESFTSLFALKIRKPTFDLTVFSNEKSEIVEIKHAKQNLVLDKKVSKIRSKFQDDALASTEMQYHFASASVKDEKMAAAASKKNLVNNVEKALTFDVENAATMNVVLNETKESVGGIVESMIRNPEAMRLVDNIRQYDNHSYKHAVDVCVLMIAFGRELHLPKDDLIELGIGGLLHDIGEVSPKEGKQLGVKNIAMFSIYKSHVADGIEMLSKSPYSEIVKTIVAEHHEHYDGTGYPNGLCCIDQNPRKFIHIPIKNKQPISMYGRMIAIVDNYVSLTSGRSNAKPVVPSEAMSYITKKAGTYFDPVLCDAFSQVIGVYPVGAYVELNTSEVALVVQQNKAWRLNPVLKIVTDASKTKVQPFVVDLMNQKGAVHRAIKKDIAVKQS
jgi:putative nucleotidyltransferase with HDIG domain